MDFLDDGERHPLQEAISANQTALVSDILATGSWLELRDGQMQAPLHWACSGSEKIDVVKNLIVAGADVNATDRYGRTPLHCACFNGQDNAVQELISCDANLNTLDSKGMTPLSNAIVYWAPHRSSDHFLAQAASCPGNMDSQVVSEIVRQLKELDAESAAKEIQARARIVKLLLNAGADPDASTVPPFVQAARLCDSCPEFVLILLEYGAKICVDAEMLPVNIPRHVREAFLARGVDVVALQKNQRQA